MVPFRFSARVYFVPYREWRITKERGTADTHPWLIHRHIAAEGDYTLFLRCTTWQRAIDMVNALIRFDKSFADSSDT